MDGLSVWTIYDKPKDHPEGFIARRFQVASGSITATEETLVSANLEEIQDELDARGFAKLARSEDDHPSVVESWI